MSEKSIPGMTTEIFKEFLENTITYVCADNRPLIKDIFKGKNDFFGYNFPGLADCECEVTTDGNILTHWITSDRPKIKYSVALADFDDVMMGKMAPMTAMVTKKLKVDGPMSEAMKFINLMPALKVAYRKSRKEIGNKYGLNYFMD
jgi:hypothetical protein